MAMVNKLTTGDGENVKERTLLHSWWDCNFVQSLWKTILSFLQKFQIKIPYDPAVPFLGIFSRKVKILI